ncbi:MAG: M1 family metallopeptidase [Chitinophagaceae bacterium]|nr:M1 family metallopeptidase [Chitinophagaceae bacterium]
MGFVYFWINTKCFEKIITNSFLCCQLPTVNCQLPPYWQQQVDYKIYVSLNDKNHSLDGHIKIDYFNNSPDTLSFIWIHVWPNAYKNDKTALSDQLLENGSTDFYFSDDEKKGYINRLSFTINGALANIQDHPEHQDIIKIILPKPLLPKSIVKIETPFHVKLPYNFSRGGHTDQTYQITQWYPKPAVYDKKGWHAMPYLDQGEFYSEFGNYEVQITLPSNYIVAATGELQNKELLGLTINKNKENIQPASPKEKNKKNQKIKKTDKIPLSAKENTTWKYEQKNVHDFAWFADKTFSVTHDTLQLNSGRVINLFSYYHPSQNAVWQNSNQFLKKSILSRSKWLGEYPYNVVSAVETPMGFAGGMEYPTITSISPVKTAKDLESIIQHEVGHNWNYGILATNEREHPWMDEGINSYYDERYEQVNMNNHIVKKEGFFEKKIPENFQQNILNTLTAIKKDQPIETASEKFSVLNYGAIAYYKTAQWLKLLEEHLGTEIFDKCMQEYYNQWKFKHPYPGDFKNVIEEISHRNVDSIFNLLTKKGSLEKAKKKQLKLTGFFNLAHTDKYQYIALAPSIGNNYYDKFMIGVLLHNYSLPLSKFNFFISPLYATGSKRLNGIGSIGYNWFPGSNGSKIKLSLAGATFTGNTFTDSVGNIAYLDFSKIVPSLKVNFAPANPRSSITKYLQWKTFFINERGVSFARDTIKQIDIISYPVKKRYINQLQYVVENNRKLYPYKGALQVEQGNDFARINFTGNYFFNYPKGGGMNVRLFAGKFFYLTDKTFIKQFETEAYHLNMTGPNGNEDYTYSNYFMGRNEFDNFYAQQIMMRDGAFKVRTDFLNSKIGKTDNWLSAINFTTDIPKLLIHYRCYR